MTGRIIFRILMAIVLIAVLVGIGVYIYNAGVAQGLASSGELAVPEDGRGVYPYYGPFYRPWGFGFFPFGIIFPILGFFLLFGLIRALFFRGWYGHGPRYWGGPYGDGPRDVPPAFEEWHRKMHESQGGSQPPQG